MCSSDLKSGVEIGPNGFDEKEQVRQIAADCEGISYSLHYTFKFITLLEVSLQLICCDCLTFISLYYYNYTLVLRCLAT